MKQTQHLCVFQCQHYSFARSHGKSHFNLILQYSEDRTQMERRGAAAVIWERRSTSHCTRGKFQRSGSITNGKKLHAKCVGEQVHRV